MVIVYSLDFSEKEWKSFSCLEVYTNIQKENKTVHENKNEGTKICADCDSKNCAIAMQLCASESK